MSARMSIRMSIRMSARRYDERGRVFKPHQKIATDGAHGAEYFEAHGHHWLAVANFGDRLGKR